MKTKSIQINPHLFETALLCSIFLVLIACSKKEKHDDSLNEQVQITSKEMKPDGYFTESLAAFANKDYAKSSSSIKSAIQSMNEIASFTPANQQKEINNSIEELNELASNVSVDKVEGINELNYFFARAGKALAGLHMHTTENYYFDLHGEQAGNELMEALSVIESTIKFHGRELSESESTLIKDGKSIAAQLEKGKSTKEDLESYLSTLSDHLKKMDSELDIKFESLASKRKTEVHTK